MAKGPMTDHQKLIAARSAMKALRAENKRLRETVGNALSEIHEICRRNDPCLDDSEWEWNPGGIDE